MNFVTFINTVSNKKLGQRVVNFVPPFESTVVLNGSAYIVDAILFSDLGKTLPMETTVFLVPANTTRTEMDKLGDLIINFTPIDNLQN